MGSDTPTYVLDANVLIDYQNGDLEVLSLVASELGAVLVSSQVVIDEVEGLTIEYCESLGIVCVDPSMEHLALAQASDDALSFHDLLCFALARNKQAICVTNDRRLRNHCADHGLGVRWGLQLMLELVNANALTSDQALTTATEICHANPTLGQNILERFARELEESIENK